MFPSSSAHSAPLVGHPDRRSVRVIALATVALIVVMVVVPFVLDEGTRLRLYGDERGTIEILSTWAWVAVALLLPVVLRSCSPAVVAASVVCLAFAAREADWHKLYTGYSVLKPKFYLLQEQPWATRVTAAILVLASIAAAGVALGALWRFVRRDGGVHAAWVRLGIIVAALAIGLKIVDRLPQMLRERGVEIPVELRLACSSIEELGELLLPVLALTVAILFARNRRRCGDPFTSGRSADSASASGE